MTRVFDVTTFSIILLLLSLTIVVGLTTASKMKEVYVERSEQCMNAQINTMSYRVLKGMSMQPTWFDGDTALAVPYNKSRRLVSGDIVSVRIDERKNRAHRVVSVYEDYFLMKGDNNEERDEEKYNYSDINAVICGVLRT